MTGIIQGSSTATFEAFMNFTNLLSDPKQFKEAIADTRKIIKELNKAEIQHKDVLKIVPTVEAATKLLEKNKLKETELTKMSEDLGAKESKINLEVAREESLKLKENRKVAKELKEKAAAFDIYKTEIESSLMIREDSIEEKEATYLQSIESHQRSVREFEEHNKRVADAIGGN